MKLIFNKLETPSNFISVAFDGIHFKSYNVADIKRDGYISFTKEDCPDFTKVKVKGQFSTIDSININKTVELESGESNGISCTFEKDVFEEVTYYCFAYDDDNNGEIDDDEVHNFVHIWVKELTPNTKLEPFIYDGDLGDIPESGIPDSADSLVSYYTFYTLTEAEAFAKLNDDTSRLMVSEIDEEDLVNYTNKRYPEGDLVKKVKVGTEIVTEIITEIQEEPTVTENNRTIADEGKAFKSITTNVTPPETCLYFWKGDNMGYTFQNHCKGDGVWTLSPTPCFGDLVIGGNRADDNSGSFIGIVSDTDFRDNNCIIKVSSNGYGTRFTRADFGDINITTNEVSDDVYNYTLYPSK